MELTVSTADSDHRLTDIVFVVTQFNHHNFEILKIMMYPGWNNIEVGVRLRNLRNVGRANRCAKSCNHRYFRFVEAMMDVSNSSRKGFAIVSLSSEIRRAQICNNSRMNPNSWFSKNCSNRLQNWRNRWSVEFVAAPMDVSNPSRKDFSIALLSFQIRRAQISRTAVTENFQFRAQMRSRKGWDPSVRPGLLLSVLAHR